MIMSHSQKAREQLYRSQDFRKKFLQKVGSGHGFRPVLCLDVLLDAGLLPSASEDNSVALATDAATILLAIGSQQTHHESVLRVTKRLREMNFKCHVGKNAADDGPTADIMQRLPSTSFANDIAALFENLWRSVHGKSARGFRPTAVQMFWSDERGATLFGVIEQWSTKRKRLYSNTDFPNLEGTGWDFVQLPTVGGSSFEPLTVLRLGEILEQGVAGSPAAISFGEA
jgi:hypothetical protein